MRDHGEVKAELARRVVEAIERGQLTQAAAARLLQVDQPKVSRLLHGQLAEFSTSRLLRFLTLLGRDVEITIGAPPMVFQEHVGTIRVVVSAGSA